MFPRLLENWINKSNKKIFKILYIKSFKVCSKFKKYQLNWYAVKQFSKRFRAVKLIYLKEIFQNPIMSSCLKNANSYKYYFNYLMSKNH